jgi:predicted enzyme related to lactoylglutathione lyase
MTTGLRRIGDFCWINMLTAQPDAACAFFTEVLGWSYGEIPGMGYSIKVQGQDIGGLFDLEGPGTPPGTPPMIGVMVKVESADATAARVRELGGTALDPFDVGPAGRMAVCHDPNGAQFDVWQPNQSAGTSVDTSLHGAPSWFETLTSDVARGTAFYTALFGWTVDPLPMSGFVYQEFKLEGTPIAGMMQITPEMGDAKPLWAPYFTVTNADEAAKQAVAAGGSICIPVQDIPNVGRFCGIQSPQKVMFHVIEYAAK